MSDEFYKLDASLSVEALERERSALLSANDRRKSQRKRQLNDLTEQFRAVGHLRKLLGAACVSSATTATAASATAISSGP